MTETLIDLTPIYSNTVEQLSLQEEVSFPPEFLAGSPILKLENVRVKGIIEKETTGDTVVEAEVEGTMYLEDAITLEEVPYPFSLEIDAILDEMTKKDENTLDLRELLWENIVLEIPLKFTKVTDLSEFHGDGWKLVSEEDATKEENPFSELLNDFGEE